MIPAYLRQAQIPQGYPNCWLSNYIEEKDDLQRTLNLDSIIIAILCPLLLFLGSKTQFGLGLLTSAYPLAKHMPMSTVRRAPAATLTLPG